MRYLATGCLSLLLFAATANAARLEGSSDHVVIYGDHNEKAIQGLAERLELFHAAMAHVFGRQEQRPSPSNRVMIFVVPSQDRVREVVAADNRYLAGIYLPRAGTAIAVVPKLRSASSDYEISGEKVLYHEYAHDFMSGMTARTCPRWFVEGLAEFFAGVTFKPDGSVGLGAPPMHRAVEIARAREVPIRTLPAFDGGAGKTKSGYDSFDSQSWVLFHYLQFAPERAGQLEEYQQLLATGDSALEAADRALAIDPNPINAHIQKVYALLAKSQSGALPPDSWKEARGQFVKANKVENDHPIPLVRFYLSYLEQGEPPTRNAMSGLEWAMQLAPFDPSLRWLVVQQMIRDERLEEEARTDAAHEARSPPPPEGPR